jgi:hypothetical protein
MSILKFCKTDDFEEINVNQLKPTNSKKMTGTQKKDLRDKCTRIINQHWEKYWKKKNKEDLLKNKSNSWIHNGSTKIEEVYASLARSKESSMGFLYEKIVIAISEYFNIKTFRKIKELKIKESGKNWIIDLAFERDGVTYLMEIKLGANMDNKKSVVEAKSLSVRKKTLIENNLAKNVETYLGIVTLGNGEASPAEWKMGRVSEGFSRSEVLVERELFNFISDNTEIFDFLVTEIQPVVMGGWNEILEKATRKYIAKEEFINFVNNIYK